MQGDSGGVLPRQYSTKPAGFVDVMHDQDPANGASRLGEAFWRFSLTFYARPAVAEALLALQNRAEHNVNIVLFGLWLGSVRGRYLTATDLSRIREAVKPLDTVVITPLRRLRQGLKTDDDAQMQALRRRMAGVELAAERVVQYRLAACLGGAVAPHLAADALAAAAAANLALILGEHAALPQAAVLRRELAALLRRH
ncbi:MAG TPA: TIGR02444 family protein [Stellaceae bacterium]|jgi:uncharacterized protein (TIGR02444 family)|nr:TIGR02444 family protein [Stellaceae bacterium]